MLLIAHRFLDLQPGEVERAEVPFQLEAPSSDAELRLSLVGHRLALELRMGVTVDQLAVVDRKWHLPQSDEALARLGSLVELAGRSPREQFELIRDVFEFVLGRQVEWALGTSLPTEFVPDSDDDRRFLEPLNDPHFEGERGSGAISMDLRSGPVCAENVGFLWDRAVAVRLYGDANRAHSPTSAVRDLWRVLESAFREKDDELVRLLSEYADAQRMGFNEEELRALLILRGRASHAESRIGLEEVEKVDADCRKHRQRLSHLVERVIITKESWGYPTCGCLPVPLRGHVGRDGELIYYIEPTRENMPSSDDTSS